MITNQPVPGLWSASLTMFGVVAIVLAIAAGPACAWADGASIAIVAGVGPAWIQDAGTVGDRTYDAAVAVAGLADFIPTEALSLVLRVSYGQFSSDGGSLVGGELGGGWYSPLYETGPAEKQIWMIAPMLRVRLPAIVDEQIRVQLRAGLGAQLVTTIVYGDHDVDQAVTLPPRIVKQNDAVPIFGAGLELGSHRTWLAIDWEMTVNFDERGEHVAQQDSVNYLYFGIGHVLD